MGRSTKVEKNFRVDTVYKLLSEGNSRGQILQFAAKEWNVSDRQIDTYIADARDKLLADAEMERPAWVAEALQRLRTYEQAAYKSRQNQVAINAVQAQAKLIGLDM
jgi:hypothetical protein